LRAKVVEVLSAMAGASAAGHEARTTRTAYGLETVAVSR
jgi:hypothetical protein